LGVSLLHREGQRCVNALSLHLQEKQKGYIENVKRKMKHGKCKKDNISIGIINWDPKSSK